MELYVLRHAIAVERGTPGYEDDSRRPLTAQGRKKMRANARGLKALGLKFDHVLSSPYARAKETAAIVLEVMDHQKKMVLTNHLLPSAAFEDLIKELRARYKKDDHMLLVGHEPHLSHFVSFLLTPGQQISMEFKKGGICRLSLPKIAGPGGATLHWLLTPAQLQRLKA